MALPRILARSDAAIELAEPAADRRYAVRADLVELSQHRCTGAAPNPRTLTGRFGASSDVLRFPSGLSSGFPFAQLGSSPSPACFRFPFVRRSPAPSLRPSLSGFVPLRFPSGSLSVSAISTLALPRAGQAGVGPVWPGPRSPVPARSWRRWRRSVATQMLPGSGSGRRTATGPTRQRTITCT